MHAKWGINFISSITMKSLHDFLVLYEEPLANHLTLNFNGLNLYNILHGSVGTNINRITLISCFKTFKRIVYKNCLTNTCALETMMRKMSMLQR